MKNIFLILLTLIHFPIFAEDQKTERRAMQIQKIHKYYTPLGYAEVAENIDLMSGNGEFGFFIKRQSDSSSICRMRFKVICDYGFDINKPLKSKKINFMFEKTFMYSQTDSDGLVDVWFNCPTDFKSKTISVGYGSYNKDIVVKNFPQKLILTEKECKD